MLTNVPGRMSNSNRATICRDEMLAGFREYLEVPDETLIDVCMAVALHSTIQESGTPIWIVIIGPSGAGKTQIASQPFQKWTDRIYNIDMITPRTFVTGFVKGKDLLPSLQGKLVLLKDLSSITEARPDSAKEIFAQLRHIFDGNLSGNWGSGKDSVSYKTQFDMIACITDSGWNKARDFNAQLGERIVPFSMRLRATDRENLGQRAIMNASAGRQRLVNETVQIATMHYMRDMMEYTKNNIRNIELSPSVSFGISNLLTLVNNLRTVAEYENNGSVKSWVYSDSQGRLADTLTSLAKILAVIYGHNEIGTDEINVVRRIAYDLVQKERMTVIEMLYREQLTNDQLIELLRLRKYVVDKLMDTMWGLGIVIKHVDTEKAEMVYRLSHETRELIDKSQLFSASPVNRFAAVSVIPSIIRGY